MAAVNSGFYSAEETFEDTKGIKCRKSKMYRQYSGRKKKDNQ